MKFLKRLFGQPPQVRKPAKGYIDERIRWATAVIHDEEDFQQRISIVSEELGSCGVDCLSDHLHSEHSPPDEIADRFPGLGDWIAARHRTIFEIFYRYREASLPAVRKIAFGEYDWTQANAVDLLCRFAKEGIESEAIPRDIAREMNEWRYEAILYTANSLAQLAADSEDLAAALHNLITEWFEDDPIDALDLLDPLSVHAPDLAKRYESMLRDIMNDVGRGERDALLDGEVVVVAQGADSAEVAAASRRQHPPIPDLHAIRAALALQQIFPDDEKVAKQLQTWAETHPDQTIREQIRNRF